MSRLSFFLSLPFKQLPSPCMLFRRKRRREDHIRVGAGSSCAINWGPLRRITRTAHQQSQAERSAARCLFVYFCCFGAQYDFVVGWGSWESYLVRFFGPRVCVRGRVCFNPEVFHWMLVARIKLGSDEGGETRRGRRSGGRPTTITKQQERAHPILEKTTRPRGNFWYSYCIFGLDGTISRCGARARTLTGIG